MISPNYKHQTFIAQYNANYAATTPAANAILSSAGLPEGSVVLVNASNQVLNAVPTSGRFRIAQKFSNGIRMTPLMDVGDIKITSKKHVTRTQQVTVIVYDGTTGDLPVAANSSFHIAIEKKDNDEKHRNLYNAAITAQFKTKATSSQQDFAMQAASTLAANVALEVRGMTSGPSYVSIGVLNNGTPTAVTPTATAFYGSNQIQFSAAPPAGIVAGALITVGGDTYEVKSVSGVNVVLNSIYRAANGTAITVATLATATKFGITITGVQSDFDPVLLRNYYVPRFDARVMLGDDTAEVEIKNTAEANDGLGNYEQVSWSEYKSVGYEGSNREVLNNPPAPRRSDTKTNAKYSLIQINTENETNSMMGSGKFSSSVFIYLELNSPGDDLPNNSQGDALADLLVTGFTAGDLDA